MAEKTCIAFTTYYKSCTCRVCPNQIDVEYAVVYNAYAMEVWDCAVSLCLCSFCLCLEVSRMAAASCTNLWRSKRMGGRSLKRTSCVYDHTPRALMNHLSCFSFHLTIHLRSYSHTPSIAYPKIWPHFSHRSIRFDSILKRGCCWWGHSES